MPDRETCATCTLLGLATKLHLTVVRSGLRLNKGLHSYTAGTSIPTTLETNSDSGLPQPCSSVLLCYLLPVLLLDSIKPFSCL